jgi:hypothetical protein
MIPILVEAFKEFLQQQNVEKTVLQESLKEINDKINRLEERVENENCGLLEPSSMESLFKKQTNAVENHKL